MMKMNKTLIKPYIGLSLFFSVFSLFGLEHSTHSDDAFARVDALRMLKLGLIFICFFFGYSILFSLFTSLLRYINNHKKFCNTNGLSCFLFENEPFRNILCISALIYGFWWFAFFPGTLHPDMTYHLYEGLGIYSLNKMVPVFLTKLVGFIMKISKVYFLNDNVGVIIYVAGLYVFQCLTVSYMFTLFRKLQTPFSIRWFAFFYVFIIPVFSIWCVDFGKDTPYYISMLLFICSMIDIVVSNKTKCYQYALLVMSALGVVLCRNNGYLMIAPAGILYACVFRKELKKFLLSCLIFIFILLGFNIFINTHYEVGGTPAGENLSLPILTYVSYLSDYSYELDEEEVGMITMLFSSTPDELVSSYNPHYADSLKNRFISSPTKEQMWRFWSNYKKAFFRHPWPFIKGFFEHSYGYFYPGQNCYNDRTAIYTLDFHNDYFDFKYSWKDSPLRAFLEKYAEKVYACPPINFLYRPAIQMMLLLYMAVLALKGRQKKNICVLISSLMMVFVFLSPVDAYFRYMLPVFTALPINLAWTVYSLD